MRAKTRICARLLSVALLLLQIVLGPVQGATAPVAPATTAQGLAAALGDANAGAEHWIYNDVETAVARAQAEKKPLCVVFRCVATKVGADFDATVMRTNRTLIELARSQFVCVRVVDLKSIDLSRFEFDYDLPWAAMFMNADGAVYGRFGTQEAGEFDALNKEVALQRAMLQVLALHAEYPTNAPALAGKRGAKKAYRTVAEMPGFDGRLEAYGPEQGQTCVRCHAVHDAENSQWQAKGFLPFEKLWRYPSPESIGLQMDPKNGGRIQKVLSASPAQLAGLEEGDLITRLDRQLVISVADIQWALHNLANTNLTLDVEFMREVLHHVPGDGTGAPVEFTREQRLGKVQLRLARGWKRTDFAWRASNLSIKPRLGFTAVALSDEEIFERNLPPGVAAHRVNALELDRPEGRAAADAGLQVGDVIVAVGGKAFSLSPRELQLFIKQGYKAGDKVPLTIFRAGRPQAIQLPLSK